MKFEDYELEPEVLKGIKELGFNRPTDIQFKSIPNILQGEDLLAIAQTGTGKTAAFCIPIIDRLYYKKMNQRRPGGVKALILTPTHELAIQINDVFSKIAKYTNLKSVELIGGVNQDPQIAKLTKGVDVVVATPGRMFDLISQGHLRTNDIDTLVLDEADFMLDLGFINDIKSLITKLPKRRQTLFFSATINDKIKKTAYKIVNQNAIRIQLSPKDPVSKNVTHYVAYIEMDHKRFFLEKVIQENPSTKILAFVRTKIRAERVKAAMKRVDIEALAIHGNIDQIERSKVLQEFTDGKVNLLIATDVTARGIDIPEIKIVVNYDLPTEAENYVHRVGRTGRGNNKGFAYSFCAAEEKPVLEEIQTFLNNDIQVLKVNKDDYEGVLNIEVDRSNDVHALMEEFNNSKKRKKKKK